MKKNKTYYENILEKWNTLDTIEEKRRFYGEIDFSKKIDKDSDTNIIKEINMHMDLIKEGVYKDREDSSSDNGGFIWDDEKIIKNKIFPIDCYGSHLMYGVMIPKTVDNVIRGEVIGKKQIYSPCLINSKGQLMEYSKRVEEDLKIKFESIPSSLPKRWELKDIKKFIDGENKKINLNDLFKKIKNQYKKYLFIRDLRWYDAHALWDLMTYVYPLFEAIPFFELRGIAGTAKSKSMTISSFISFNGGQVMVNPSESTLFRWKDEIRGTTYFDEAEKLWIYNKSTKQYEGDTRTELINASYTKEAKVPRQEKIGNKFVTKWYSPFGPTQLSSINGLYGATETRAITRITTKSSNNDERGEKQPEEERNDKVWSEIRNECYRFGLTYSEELKIIYSNFPKDCPLKRRDLQIWKPILSIALLIDKELYDSLVKFASEITQRNLDDLVHESSFDFMCLSALKEVIEKNTESDKIHVELIKYAFCNAKGDEDGKKDIYLNRNISKHLDKLGFKELRNKDSKGSFFAVTKDIFNEIVNPICPKLSFLSSPSSLSSHLPIKEENNYDDSMMMNEDKEKKDVTIMTIDDENDDGWKKEDINFREKNKKNLIENPKIEVQKIGGSEK